MSTNHQEPGSDAGAESGVGMTGIQQQIDDLRYGKYREWHLEAARTSTYGDLGREWTLDEPWGFVCGFDSEGEAQEAMKRVARECAVRVQYGADDFDFRVRNVRRYKVRGSNHDRS